jgi:hypothetical protein
MTPADWSPGRARDDRVPVRLDVEAESMLKARRTAVVATMAALALGAAA